MKVSEICRARTIQPIDVSTPLLVPSFSSRGFPDIKNIYLEIKNFIVDVSLISAYDLYHSFVDSNIYYSDLIFIDSGGYETQAIKSIANLDDLYAARDSYVLQPWSLDQYQSVLDNLEPNSQFVFISYDAHSNSSIPKQIELSLHLFKKYSTVASEFLCKPETQESNHVNIEQLLNYTNHIAKFSILGLTEKELGASILERCHNLLRLRSTFQASGIETPIHVLGCLEPVLMIVYFLCGADIFDGLAWLRYVFFNGLTLYPSNATLLQEKWSFSEYDLPKLYSIQNLQVLNHLSKAMRRFQQTGQVDEFSEWVTVMPHMLNLVKDAGLEFEE